MYASLLSPNERRGGNRNAVPAIEPSVAGQAQSQRVSNKNKPSYRLHRSKYTIRHHLVRARPAAREALLRAAPTSRRA